jgi:hypothetical protein
VELAATVEVDIALAIHERSRSGCSRGLSARPKPDSSVNGPGRDRTCDLGI